VCSFDGYVTERDRMGINQIANISEAAIVGQITAISSARWNSKDGAKWCPDDDGDVAPIVYRDVTVKVTETIYTSEGLAPRGGDEIVVRSFGDGRTTGEEAFRFNDGRVLREGEVDGHFEVGKEALLVLSLLDHFPTESGLEVVNQVTGSWGGNWEIDREQNLARSVEAERTVPFRALVERLVKEREIGRQAARDPGTTKDPLAENTVSPSGPADTKPKSGS
jgi:hypothetical protein